MVGKRTGSRVTLGLMAAMALAMLPAGASAESSTITVNRTGDQPDLDGGTGSCDVSPSAGAQCTLRAAIETANATVDRDTIAFSFPGSAVVRIAVTSELPHLTSPAVIDGYSAGGTRRNSAVTGTDARLRVVLDGPGTGSFAGLTLDAATDLAGLIVQDFKVGVFIGELGTGSTIRGNFVGTDASGTRRAANGQGIHVDCDSSVQIGGGRRSQRNLISGNGDGIILCERTQGTRVQGNLIGVARDGRSALGNSSIGIWAFGTHDVVIGGDRADEANTIAFNEVGILIESADASIPSGIQILRNAIDRNARLGIDLEGDGPTADDGAGDADVGANGLQNRPVVSTATATARRTVIKGSLASGPSRQYSIRLYENPPKGTEGWRFLKVIRVTTDAAGIARFSVTVPRSIAKGRTVTATATDETTRETSEFSAARRVTRP